jgi:mono/diheme cytochrome c family protein
MKKIKININRTPVSKEEIESKRNFENVLAEFRSYSKPFYTTKLFLNSLFLVIFAMVTVYTVTKLEREVKKAQEHENDGYVKVSEVKEISSVDSLETQEFVVRIDRDTTLHTTKGALITIPSGSLQSTDKDVVLVLKEAYSMEDMIRGGLTTKSGKELLSSGGMFYIRAKDSARVKIVKPIAVSVPTDEMNADMKLYKGQPTAAGKIDWQDPVPLKPETSENVVSEGEILFKENCKSCHTLGKESVGPDLAYIGKRRDFDWLKLFINNSSSMIKGGVKYMNNDSTAMQISPGEGYACCLYNKYNKAEMTAFVTYTDKDIKALCDYFTDESKRLKLPYPKDETYINFQKCKTYNTLIASLNAQKNMLKNKRIDINTDNTPFIKKVNRSMKVMQMPDNAALINSADRKLLIRTAYQQSEYYQIEINSFGWYNIDMLTKNAPGLVASNLIVHVDTSFINTFNIYFVLPDMNVHARGGLLKNKNDTYGFYEDNGNIKLPQGKTAHVYLVGEKKGQLIYAAATFTTGTLNTISLSPAVISKEAFNLKIKELLNTEGISVEAKDSKHAASLRKIDFSLNELEEKIKAAELLTPKDCNCSCSTYEENVVDTIITVNAGGEKQKIDAF